MRVGYSFSVLRYVHDPVTEEFVNVGVADFSPEARYVRAICTTSCGRIRRMFQGVDGSHILQLAHYIQDRICASGLEYESGLAIEQLLSKVLPADDSALQFSKAGVGLSADLDRTLNELFQRHVELYTVEAFAEEVSAN